MSAYTAYLDDAIASLEKEIAGCKSSGREDEAALTRIRLNIHDVCRTILGVCTRTAQGSDMRALYLEKLDRLQAPWQASLALARQHGDDCKAVIEEIKLSVLAENRAKFIELE